MSKKKYTMEKETKYCCKKMENAINSGWINIAVKKDKSGLEYWSNFWIMENDDPDTPKLIEPQEHEYCLFCGEHI